MKNIFLILIATLTISSNANAIDWKVLADKAYANKDKIAEVAKEKATVLKEKHAEYKERKSSSSEDFISFREAKKLMYSKIYTNPNEFESFYCGCDFERKKGKYGFYLKPDLNSCGYEPRKNPKRANRTEAEHIVPASHFGQQKACWRNAPKGTSGRKNCEKTDPEFSKMEGDLHNLVPTIGEVNGNRSNFKFGMLNYTQGNYGQCNFDIDFKRRLVEPRDEVKGDVARIYLYFYDKYNLKLSSQQEKMFKYWHSKDPVDSWEIKRNRLIKSIQGDSNHWVE